jgi:hypothetical protein
MLSPEQITILKALPGWCEFVEDAGYCIKQRGERMTLAKLISELGLKPDYLLTQWLGGPCDNPKDYMEKYLKHMNTPLEEISGAIESEKIHTYGDVGYIGSMPYQYILHGGHHKYYINTADPRCDIGIAAEV